MFTYVEIGRISGPNIVTPNIDIVVLNQLLSHICFHTRCLIMNKYDFIHIYCVFFIFQERKHVLNQNCLTKILASPGFVFLFHYPMSVFGGETDKNSNTCLIFYHFMISLILFNIFHTFGPNSIILMIRFCVLTKRKTH